MSRTTLPQYESRADRIRRNDKSLTVVEILDDQDDAIEILDALKNNSNVKKLSLQNGLQENQEALAKLSEVMRCNKSVEFFTIILQGGLLCGRFFATIATSGGWSSIKVLHLIIFSDNNIAPLSLTDAEHISSFIIHSDNLRTLTLDVAGNGATPIQIVETLSRTKVQSLVIRFRSPVSLLNGGRRFATALERCNSITELWLKFSSYVDQLQLFQILLIESIPKLLGLKKLDLEMNDHVDQQFFDMMGQCIGGHEGEVEELRLMFYGSSVNLSIVGLAPALRRLKVIHFGGYAALTLQRIGELSGIAEDCDALEEFGCNLSPPSISSDDFKAFFQLLSRFPSLKRVTQYDTYIVAFSVNLRNESRFVAFLEMVQRSKTIEQVPSFRCCNAEDEAAIKHHCRNNMIHNRIDLIRKKGLLAATVFRSAWPLILNEFSDMPDVLYYLLQQKHGAMIGPTCHGCNKRKQDFGQGP